MKSRKRTTIEATQFFHVVEPWPPGVVFREAFTDKGSGMHFKAGYYVQTLEGPLQCVSGDWIATGVRGEHYPIDNAIFRETYEAVP